MDGAAEVLEALEARAEVRSLEELGRRGRSRVKVIRPSEIASMLREAVERALAGSDFVPPERVAALVQEGRAEFQQLLARREAELEESARQARALEDARGRISALESELEQARQALSTRPSAPEPALGGAGAELLMKLMGEVLELKGRVAETRAAEGPSSGGLADKLEQIVGALDSKIERLGRKVGVHEAVEGGQPCFDALFAHQDADLESNLDTVKIKERSGSGIGANLAKMKKMRQKGN